MLHYNRDGLVLDVPRCRRRDGEFELNREGVVDVDRFLDFPRGNEVYPNIRCMLETNQ